MSYKILRPIAILVLFFFSWTFLGIYNLAYAIDKQLSQSALAANQPKEQKTEEKFGKSLKDIEDTIEKLKKVQTHEEREAEKEGLRQKRQEIEGHDTEIKSQFAETEEKIKGLPDEIKQRHKDFVKKYEENLNTLRRNLEEIEKAETAEEVKVEVEKAKTFLEKTKPPSKHTPLDPNKLPHRKAEPTKKKPRLKYDNQESGVQKPILVASIGDLQGILANAATQALPPPTQADLSETIEVQFTQQIKDLANQLQNNPVKIYEWVRNNIEFVPTYGSIQGADMCLQTKQCNAFDTASLLIALLRTSNIPAKYVYGTIEIPIEKVMNWAGGFTDANSALDFIASGGIPVSGIISGGKISTARMEHVWVEAWVDYIPSRGAVHKQGDTWIPLDASFKQYMYKSGMDMYTVLSLNGTTFFNEHLKQPVNISPFQDFGRRIVNYFDTNLPDATITDLLGDRDISFTKVIIDKQFPYLPATLSNKVIAIGNRFTYLPATLRHSIVFELSDIFGASFSFPINTPTLIGKRITLSYEPATSADEALIIQYGNIFNVPAYLLNLKPVLKIEGKNVISGNVVGMGNEQTFRISFITPNSTDMIENKVIAGDYSAITINIPNTSTQLASKRIDTLLSNSKIFDSVSLDDLLGEILYVIGLSYLKGISLEEQFIGKTMQIVYSRPLAELMTTSTVTVTYLFSIPKTVKEGGINFDVDRNITTPFSVSGDSNRIKDFMILIGMSASAWEHQILESFYNIASVSAVKLLKLAEQQGIAVHTIDRTNAGQILPTLQVSSEVIMDIQNAINTGKSVIISQTNILYNKWVGVGYITLDSTTGAAAYRISGGLSGGGTSSGTSSSQRQNASFREETTTMVVRLHALRMARGAVGSPYAWGGYSLSTGFDCSGLITFAYDLPKKYSASDLYAKKEWIRKNELPLPGDILFMSNQTHAGICGGDGRLDNHTVTWPFGDKVGEKMYEFYGGDGSNETVKRDDATKTYSYQGRTIIMASGNQAGDKGFMRVVEVPLKYVKSILNEQEVLRPR